MRSIRLKLMITIMSILLLATTGGVFATWHYAQKGADSVFSETNVVLSHWEGSEILPTDRGANHLKMVDNVLNSTTVDGDGETVGMNNPNSYINKQIETRQNWGKDTVGSMDWWQSANISNYYDTETVNVSFMIQSFEDNENLRYMYSTSCDLGGQNSPNYPVSSGEYIYPIYRTTLLRTYDDQGVGTWNPVETKVGYARSAWYANTVFGSWVSKDPAFDCSTWSEGKLGTGTSNAIYTYVGISETLYLDSSSEYVYLKIIPTSNANVTISSTSAGVSIRVYNTAMSEIKTTSGTNQGDGRITFKPTANTTYYVEMYGNMDISYTIE